MNNAVNLLPAQYVKAIQRRRHTRVLLLTAIAIACAAMLWWRIAAMKLNPILSQTQDIVRQIESEKFASRSLEQSQALCRKLETIESLRNEMNEPIDVAKVMELLSQIMPADTALTKLTLTLPQLPDQKPAKSQSNDAPKAEPATPAPILIDMNGVARTNPDVAKCVGALASHPLFTNVKLSNSKQLLDTKISIVGFKITMEIPVNRKFTAPKPDQRTEPSANAQ